MRFCSAQVVLLALFSFRASGLRVPAPSVDPAKLNLKAVTDKMAQHLFIWGLMCNDKAARSCAPTKALERQVLDRLRKESSTPSATALAQDLLGYLQMVTEMKRQHPTLATAWKVAPKTEKNEIEGWASLGLDAQTVPSGAFALADSDKSGGLSEYEVIDFMHECLEIGGATKGLLAPQDFDAWAYGDWAGLQGPEREAAAAEAWVPPQ